MNTLHGTRAYLSGPMDFVGSRLVEKYLGWRSILTPVLKALGITVLDPWNKPVIRGHKRYGQEGVFHSREAYEKDFWTNPSTRARFETDFWETVHIDLRMTDLSDFVIAFVPTNIYSVGTVHEIVVARTQHKPALMISPPVHYDFFPELAALSPASKEALKFYGLKENPNGIPSQWYGTIVGGHNIFDGFGWEHLLFKEPDFYSRLIEAVLAAAAPQDQDSREYETWEKVRQWCGSCESLTKIKGGILDQIRFPDEDEKTRLHEALNKPAELEREYFWYNKPYTPKRPVLYQLLCIAAGIIPPRLNIVHERDAAGEIIHRSYESVDDSWLLISAE